MSEQRFTARIRPSERGGGGHLVEVPADVVRALGGKGRIPVQATFNGIPYRGSVVRMGGVACIGILKTIVERAGLGYGDAVDVTLAPDTQERTVEVPTDLAEALDADPAARAAWERLSYTTRKEHARAIAEAKKPETRARRLARIVGSLGADG